MRLQTVQPLLHGGREGVRFFPGKKQRSLFWGLQGYNRGLSGLLMGCGGTMAEGGREATVGLLRMNSHHIQSIHKQTLYLHFAVIIKSSQHHLWLHKKAQLLQHIHMKMIHNQ